MPADKPQRKLRGGNPPEDDHDHEMEELRKSIEFMSAELTKVSVQQKQIIELIKEVQELKKESIEKDKTIKLLENRVADLEQYSRMNDVIVSGLKTRHRSYARVAAPGSGAAGREGVTSESETEMESLEQQVAVFLDSKGISMDRSGIEACHTLPTRTKGATPAIIIRFTNRKSKIAILKQGRKLKGTDVYINEHLTKRNGDIAKRARILRKQGKIQSTWTASCKVFIKLNGETPEEEKVMVIKDISELDKYDV